MAIKITTVEPSALDGVIRARADGLYMAMVDAKRLFWRAVEIRNGHVARHSGFFPDVIGWLFTRAGVLPKGRAPKIRNIDRDRWAWARGTVPAPERVPGAQVVPWTEPYHVEEVNGHKSGRGWGRNTLKPGRDDGEKVAADIPAG